MKPGPIAWFAGNPVAANLLMLFFIIGGLVSGAHLAVQHFPPFDPRTVTVTVPFPGASPQEVEQDVNRRIEESVIGLAGVERVVGTAAEGLGRIRIELSTFADATSALNDVQAAVDGIENFPPVAADYPEVELRQLALEVMTLAVSSTAAGEDALRRAAENLRDGLLELPSISQVTLKGTRDREISIELSEEELRRHNLTFNQIADAVQRASLNLTFGELRTEAGGVVLHTASKRRRGDEFKDIPLITRLDGTIVTLGDVAEIRDGFVDQDIVTRFNGQPTVLVRVDATEAQSVVGMAREIKSWLEGYDPPPDVTVGIWNDRAQPSLDRLSEIVRNGVIGALLVFLSLVLLFDLRIATWVTVGIPLSFIGSLLFFAPADLTLNMGTIFGFFLMVGIVVDDAVVVGESIAAERERGKRSLEAAISGARAVVGPITVGVITTVLGFLPFLFITTATYQIVNVFPWVAFFVLLVSLIEAFFILPAHLSHEKRWSVPPLSRLQDFLRDWLDGVRDRVVAPAVSWSVRNITLTLACAGPGGGRLGVPPEVGDGANHHHRQGRQPVRQRPGRPGASHRCAVRRDARERGAFRRCSSRRQRPAWRNRNPVDQHRRGQPRLDAADGHGRAERQSPGVGEAPSARTADSHRVAREYRTPVAPACRRRVLPGEGGVPDHPRPGLAHRRLCGQA